MSKLNEKVKDVTGCPIKPDKYVSSKRLVNNRMKIGLELEAEGFFNPTGYKATESNLSKGPWTVCNDGSLRNMGKEFKHKVPLSGQNLIDSVELLQTALKSYEEASGFKVLYNMRTSLHVHLNFSDKKFIDVFAFVVLFLVYEELLTRYSGKRREESIYSYPVYKHPVLLERIIKQVQGDIVLGENDKYCSLNVGSLSAFGTVEVRLLGGTHKAIEILRWLNFLLRIYNASQALIKTGEIFDIPSIISSSGYIQFGKKVFKAHWSRLIKEVSEKELERMLVRGVRTAQELVYSVSLGDNEECVESSD